MTPAKNSLINIHSHYKPKRANEFVLRNAYLNLSSEKLSNLPYATSVGLHPWFLNQYTINQCTDILIELASSEKVLAIGEIGIDRAIETPIKKQLEYFEAQFNVARALQKPIIIHAVKSYSDLIPFLKKSKIPFIFHQFSGNQQQANELLKYNAYLSFGKNLFEEKNAQTFKTLPLSTIFLETDISPITIDKIYIKAAELRNISVEELQTLLYDNFIRL